VEKIKEEIYETFKKTADGKMLTDAKIMINERG